MSTPPDSHIIGRESELVLLPEHTAVRIGDRDVPLTNTEFRIIAFLMDKPGQTYTRKELVASAIGGLVTERTVDVHIKNLREKLGPRGSQIETVRRRGYRFRVGTGGSGNST